MFSLDTETQEVTSTTQTQTRQSLKSEAKVWWVSYSSGPEWQEIIIHDRKKTKPKCKNWWVGVRPRPSPQLTSSRLDNLSEKEKHLESNQPGMPRVTFCVNATQLVEFVVTLHIPVWALQTGLLAIGRVDEVSVLLADVGEAGVVGGCVGGERPVVDVGHCGKCCYQVIVCHVRSASREDVRSLVLAVCTNTKLEPYSTWSDPVPLVLPEALQGVHAALQPIGHHAQFHGTVTHICNTKHFTNFQMISPPHFLN